MRILLIVLIFTSSLTLFSQNFEIIGGINKNSFYDLKQDDGHYRTSYNSDYGYNFRIGIENIKIDWLTLRFTLSYDKYGGDLEASDGGLGFGYTTKAFVDKSIIALGVFPINLKFIDRIDLNFGIEFAGMTCESFSGTINGWQMDDPSYSYNLDDRYNSYSSKTYFGLCGRLAYDFKITDKLIISPQYLYYLGLSKEFDEFPEQTKSMRHYFCIGLKRKLM